MTCFLKILQLIKMIPPVNKKAALISIRAALTIPP